jgi:hypothetical protein
MDVKIKGLNSVRARLVPGLYRPVLEEMFRFIANTGETVAKNNAPRDTGALKRSIHSNATDTSARIYSNLGYAVPVEFGRRKGARMPPPRALRGWARRHGMPESAAFGIAKNIQRRGIKGRFFMKKAAETIMFKMPFQIKLAEKRIAKRFSSGRY